MYDLLYRHKRIAQFVLALITLPFAFFGVDYYFHRSDNAGEVAKFEGGQITQVEFDRAIRDQQEMMRRSGQQNIDPALFDSPEIRYNLLQQLLRERLVEKKGTDLHFRISNDQLFERIAADPRFRQGDRFSLDVYKGLLAQNSIPEAAFEDSIRRQLLAEKVIDPISRGGIVAKTSAVAFVNLVEQQREVEIATIDAEAFVKDVKVDDEQVKAFYDKNAAAFNTPEELKFEYVILTQDALLGQVTVTPEEVKAQYASAEKTYGQEEQRQAAHILISVKPDATDVERAAAKKKADDIAAQAKASPAKFADLAKQYSQDPGSAAQGGDLGSSPRGTMVKPFEDAVFAMKPGEIVGPVQSDFGYHVIKLLGVTPARVRPFDEVKAQIETDLKRQKTAQKFAASADQFQNLVYEQAESLAPVAKTLGLNVATSPLVTRAQAQQIAMGNAKVVQALLSPESIAAKRNTDAIEVGPNALMAARLLEYKPAAPRPFDEVKEQIRKQLVRQGAIELAQKAGREKLAELEQGRSDRDV
ncbi:MAG TPA: SurA N-terminal domain-containing protein, partial [Casimicrobiaceae bacterium]|nr:SurA N-terminal domain-containing protein [Casimicrobiaceae bacterium]